ncbi:TIGR01906 family membrane protein [Arthrobacter burdickii]|uniref:TIGR01906 family membrane protein n=1 Tax=Arthrobacter burdickii TaxID=3035920 RepID=A0ABT8K509_9MICC|nr:TIGR01906 family membrane protein [Arthrobacter burdickii]MDN4612549.1 TIGR01906 family membrane protein [Arthrobacter burdickii]
MAHASVDDQHSSGDELPASSRPSAGAQSGGSHASTVPKEPSTDTGALSVRPPDKDAARRAAVRDQAVAAKPALPRFLQVVVALFFPVIVVAAAVRAVATSSFLWLEYHRPGFPADQFGFSLDDRMTYGSYALDYVVNLAPPRYLGGLVTPEGDPLFLESEVDHMADVKGVLGLSFLIALVLFVLAVLACVYLARKYKGGVRRALFSGAVLTLVGIAVLTVLAVLAWETFFTQVHALFFANGTWTFRIDDTLIRLFPEQFWTDSAVTIAVLVLAAIILTLALTWPTRARRERSMLAQEAAQARYREALEAS